MANITYDVEPAEDFLRFRIKVTDILKTRYLKISAILYLRSGKEYVFIPDLEETIKHITMRLSEMERSFLTSLMKIKDIVRSH